MYMIAPTVLLTDSCLAPYETMGSEPLLTMNWRYEQ